MEEFTNLMLSSGIKVEFNNDFVGWLTESSLKHDILHCSFTKEGMCQKQLQLLSDVRNKLNINVTENDMEAIMQWLWRVVYEKARSYTCEKAWLKEAPEWLLNATVRLRLLPAEQLPQPAEDMVLSACATRALLRRVHDTRGNIMDPLLEVIWEDVRQFAMLKLSLVLRQGDKPTADCMLTDMQWRIVDLVLLHHSCDDEYQLISEECLETPAPRFALDVLCELVREHRLNKCTGRGDLARRWGRAYEHYTSKGFHTSLVALQRRWFELRRRASHSGELLACELLRRVQQLAARAPAASYSWTDLVSGGMIFTHQDVIESEIMSTSKWNLHCGPLASVTAVQETNEISAMEVEEAQSTMAETNNCRLPRNTGRLSSYLMFESDDEDFCSENNFNPNSASQHDDEEDIITLADAILRIESEAVVAKRSKLLGNHSTSTSIDSKITLFDESHSIEVTVPVPETTVKTEAEESLLAYYLKLDRDNSGSVGNNPRFDLSKAAPGIAPPSTHITFEEKIDPKLLMNTKVIIEKMDIEKYLKKNRSANKRSRPSKSMYLKDDDDSSRDSGSEWSPEGAGWSSEEGCEGRADAALRPVTLRDIDEVRRRAQRKLTAQVAPVTQESGSQQDPSAPLGDGNTNTTPPPVVVEVTKYCPLGLQATRLRYGQGMYRREMDAAAAARRKHIMAKRIAAKARKKVKDWRNKMPIKCPKTHKQSASNGKNHSLQNISPKDLAKRPSEKTTENVLGDDMREWIRQRNLNARYFGPAPPLTLPLSQHVAQRRSSNPTVGVDKSAPRHKVRATSLGKESAPPPKTLTAIDRNTTTVSVSVPSLQTQQSVIIDALNHANLQMAANLASSPQSSSVIRIVPIASKEPATSGSSASPVDTQTRPQESLDTPISTSLTFPIVQLVFNHPSSADINSIPSNCAALWPVKVIPLPLNSEKSIIAEAAVEKVIEDSSAAQPQSLDNGQTSKNEKSKAVEVTAELKKTLPTIDISDHAPLIEPGPRAMSVLVPGNAIFGNTNTVTVHEYIQGEDGSRLKIICKEKTKPFWIVGGEYLVLTEEEDETVKHGAAYYTLAPPADIKRIVFESSEGADAAGEGGRAPRRLAVQRKVYRKLCSAPLRYAQVLWAVRGVQHARRSWRRGRALLLYCASRRHLAPLVDANRLLDIYNQEPTEEIIIDD